MQKKNTPPQRPAWDCLLVCVVPSLDQDITSMCVDDTGHYLFVASVGGALGVYDTDSMEVKKQFVFVQQVVAMQWCVGNINVKPYRGFLMIVLQVVPCVVLGPLWFRRGLMRGQLFLQKKKQTPCLVCFVFFLVSPPCAGVLVFFMISGLLGGVFRVEYGRKTSWGAKEAFFFHVSVLGTGLSGTIQEPLNCLSLGNSVAGNNISPAKKIKKWLFFKKKKHHFGCPGVPTSGTRV